MRARGWLLAGVVLLGCAGAGEVAAPQRERLGMCGRYVATTSSQAFVQAEALFREAEAAYEAKRDEVAARGYLAAAAAFKAALSEDPRLAAARTNMRIAYADAALVWLTASRPGEARAALERALADDPVLQARWRRAIDELPRGPACAFELEPEPAPPTVAPVRPVETPVAPVETTPAPAEAAAEPVVHEACGKVERGAAKRKHEFIGQTVVELDDSGGEILCGRDPIWQLRFGTLCGDMASFHRVVTVEVRAGKVTRVWEREQYNAAFCASSGD